MKYFLPFAFALLLSSPLVADDLNQEQKVNENLQRLIPTQTEGIVMETKSTSQILEGFDSEAGRFAKLELPPQAWPFPMVHLAPRPVLPGSAR